MRSGWWEKKRCQKNWRGTGSKVQLDSSVSTQDYGILPSAPKGKYSYTFPIYGEPPKDGRKIPEHDQPTTSGELDVTTDPEP